MKADPIETFPQTSSKRKRTRSKSQTPAKRKRTKSKSQPPKRKRTQRGGVQPPIHYPAGNYPKRFQNGGFFSSIYKKFKKEREEDCKDWMKRKQKKRKPRKQKGGRRTGKKRKTRKQTGGRRAGKKRKPRKQTGGRRAGKKRKTGNKREDAGNVNEMLQRYLTVYMMYFPEGYN